MVLPVLLVNHRFSIGAGGDSIEAAQEACGGEQRDNARRRDPTDLERRVVREPEIAVRPGRNSAGAIVLR